MVDASGPEGAHMVMDDVMAAAKFISDSKAPMLLVSGGEPFEHPQIFEAAAFLKHAAPMVVYASGGNFDNEKLETIKRLGLQVQVTSDPRYYPRPQPRERFSGSVFYEDTIRAIFPCRRTREAGIPSTRYSPGCFNLRSATRVHGFTAGMWLLAKMGKVCAPSINVDGTIRAGEADTCLQVGTVRSPVAEVEAALRTMRCGRCGLGCHLSAEQLNAIGGA
jgi:hypothetical protein